MIHNDFLDYEGLNSKEKLVMITLMRYDGTAFPSIPKLSKKIGLSERTVRYALKSLEEKINNLSLKFSKKKLLRE